MITLINSQFFIKSDDKIVATPARISMLTNAIMGSLFSMFQPKTPLEIADIVTINAELIPEALPAKLGTDWIIEVFATGHITPVPKAITIIGRKKDN